MRAHIAIICLLATAAPAWVAADPTHGEGAQKVHVDPQTRSLVAAPTIAELPADDVTYSTTAAGLYQQLSPVFRGGVVVHLQGRFQNTLRVRLEPDGGLVFTHLTAAGDRKPE